MVRVRRLWGRGRHRAKEEGRTNVAALERDRPVFCRNKRPLGLARASNLCYHGTLFYPAFHPPAIEQGRTRNAATHYSFCMNTIPKRRRGKMKKSIVGLLVIFFVFGFQSLVFAAEEGSQGTKEEAKAMVLKGEEWFKKYGKEKTLAEINLSGTHQKGAFHDRDLYLFAYDFKGVVLAHGSIPKLV